MLGDDGANNYFEIDETGRVIIRNDLRGGSGDETEYTVRHSADVCAPYWKFICIFYTNFIACFRYASKYQTEASLLDLTQLFSRWGS